MKKKSTWIMILLALAVVTAVVLYFGRGGQTDVPVVNLTTAPTATTIPTETPTATATPTPDSTQALQETLTPVPTEVAATATPEPTAILEPTETPVPTNTPVPTATSIPEPTATPTSAPTATSTPTPTATPEPTATRTPTPTNKPTPTASLTPTPSPTPTATPAPTDPNPYFALDGTYYTGDKINFLGEEVVMDSLNSLTGELAIHNIVKNPKGSYGGEPFYLTPEGYGVCTELVVSDDSVIKLNRREFKDGALIRYTLSPLDIGTTDITAYLYVTDLDGNKLEIVDAYTFTVTVEEFQSNIVFEEGDFVPAANGYPYLLGEHQVGDNCYVQVWAEDKTVKSYSGDGAVAVVAGTGDMWGFDIWWEANGPEIPEYSCVETLYIQEGITSIYNLSVFSGMTSVEYPSTLKVVGSYCFHLTELLEVVLPEGVERIEEAAYAELESISKIELPSTLEYIGEAAFDYGGTDSKEESDNLVTDVVIPASVEYIGYGAFGYRWGINITLEKGTDTSGFEKDWDLIDSGGLYESYPKEDRYVKIK